ncbi:unnamed protein product [Heligmosomoides polygyrus]|uniref:Secreted protein n=1 Tax=Heligmosomoides polygyrus TaxID=6339 RepID=A0A183FVJ7_HELPZ|nr:unnamed protein product [Heligmosomoides polygyrus]
MDTIERRVQVVLAVIVVVKGRRRIDGDYMEGQLLRCCFSPLWSRWPETGRLSRPPVASVSSLTQLRRTLPLNSPPRCEPPSDDDCPTGDDDADRR